MRTGDYFGDKSAALVAFFQAQVLLIGRLQITPIISRHGFGLLRAVPDLPSHPYRTWTDKAQIQDLLLPQIIHHTAKRQRQVKLH